MKKLKKYFKEILIVVIGILIAFGLNNWWQSRKEGKNLSNHFENLKSECDKNKGMMQFVNKSIDQNKKNIDTIYQLMYQPNQTEKLSEYTFKLINMSGGYIFKNAYNTLVETGDIRLIDDFKLKNTLVLLYDYYNYCEAVDKQHAEFYEQYFFPFLMENIDFSNPKNIKNESAFKTIEFKNMISSYQFYLQRRKAVYKDCQGFLDSFLVVSNK